MSGEPYEALARPKSLIDALERMALQRPERTAVRSHDGRVSWTWSELAERVATAAAGFVAAGVQQGDMVALLMTNRPEFYVVDLALVQIGAVPFSLYATSSPEQHTFALEDSEAVGVVSDRLLQSGLAGVELPGLRVQVDGESADGWRSLADLVGSGRPGAVAELPSPAPHDVATMIYTSGTTGTPKGVLLTHDNLLSCAEATLVTQRIPAGTVTISWLPSAHVGDRIGGYALPIYQGLEIVTLDDPRQVLTALPEIRPGYFYGPPRIFEKLRADFDAWALGLDHEPSDDDRQRWLERVGLDRVRTCVVATAPNPGPLMGFYHELGVPMGEAYGLTESSGAGTAARPDAIRIGTVGQVSAHMELRISDDGEVLLRGPQVMKGYHARPDETAAVIDDQGWLHTGDLGRLDADGYLSIIGRRKEIIVSSSGKNIAPVTVESAVLSAAPLIGQVCCIGEGRPYVVALIVLDPEYSRSWAGVNGLADVPLSELAREPRLIAEIETGVAAGNARLNRPEQIKRFRIVPGEWLPGIELTPTSKMRRAVIVRKYAELVEEMYA